MHLYVATTNPGKLRDFQTAADEARAGGFVFAPLPGLAAIAPPDEDQLTFEGNAVLKARYYAAYAPGLLVLADDSGLEVDALQGAPGVRSARYADDLGATDTAAGVDASNNAALLLAMLEQTDRRARYRCALALVRDGELLHTTFGSVEGSILTDPEGAGGFGYDPLFRVDELGKSMANASAGERSRVSHRARALRAMLGNLRASAA